MLAAGTSPGPHKILARLGAGGMGGVYRAAYPEQHRQVTNNVLSREIPAAIDLERLLREIEVAAKPTHPDLLPVQGCGTAEGLLFYVKPCVTAESLRDRVNREMQLPLEDALRFDRGWPPGGTTTPVG